MAKEIDIEINVKAKDAEKNLQTVGVGLKGIQEGAKTAGKSVLTLNNIFKANVAIKAFTIILDALKETFMSNQKVVDTLATATTALEIVFNDLFKFIESNIGTVVGFFKDIFENPVENLKALGQAIKDNIVEKFTSAIEVLGFLSEAIVKVFDGDFPGALDSLKEAGKETIDVFTGVDNSFDKIAEGTQALTKGIKDYTTETIKQAKETTKLNKIAELGAAQNRIILEQKDREAEKLRQVRDEERNTINERILANNELKEVLEEQEKLMLANVDAQVAAAQAQVDINNNQENQLLLLDAQSEKLGVLSQIEGFRSEQLANDLALDRERLELQQATAQGELEVQSILAQGQAELIDNEVLRLEKQKEIALQEIALTRQVLEDKKASYKEGTQAFIDAQNEMNRFNAESAVTQQKLDQDIKDAKIAAVLDALGAIASIVGENTKYGKAIAITSAIIDTYAGADKALAAGPPPWNFIAAGTVIAAGFANVKKIISTKEPAPPSFAKGAGGGSVPTPAISTPPAFNVVGASSESQLAQTIVGSQQKPIRAYVVSTDVSTQQSLDRKTANQATLGN